MWGADAIEALFGSSDTIDTSEAVFKLFSKVIHTAFEEGSKDYNYVKITVQRNE